MYNYGHVSTAQVPWWTAELALTFCPFNTCNSNCASSKLQITAMRGTQTSTIDKTINVKSISAKVLLLSVLRASEVFHFLKCFLATLTQNANMYYFPLCNSTMEKYFRKTFSLDDITLQSLPSRCEEHVSK